MDTSISILQQLSCNIQKFLKLFRIFDLQLTFLLSIVSLEEVLIPEITSTGGGCIFNPIFLKISPIQVILRYFPTPLSLKNSKNPEIPIPNSRNRPEIRAEELIVLEQIFIYHLLFSFIDKYLNTKQPNFLPFYFPVPQS